MGDDDFQLVVHTKRRQKFHKTKHPATVQVDSPTTTTDVIVSEECILQKLRQCRDEIKSSCFYENLTELLFAKLYKNLKSRFHLPKMAPQSNGGNTDSEEMGKSISEDTRTLEESFNSLSVSQDQKHSFDNRTAEDLTSTARTVECCSLVNTELFCYGVGNFAECKIAQYQLALVIALWDQLELPSNQCQAYDPVWSVAEKSVIQKLGFSLITNNEEGKHSSSTENPSIYFLPHCGTALCNNLLWANWRLAQLSNMIVIGNSFSHLVERNPKRILQQKAGYIWNIYPATEEVSLPNSFKYSDVFNDTSIHSFPLENLTTLPTDLWENCTEPKYDLTDVEIIVNK